MEKKILLLAVVICMTCLCSSQVFALDFLGPPASILLKGQTSVGLAYFSGQMDLDVDLKITEEEGFVEKVKDEYDGVKQQRAFVDVSHGLDDNIDIFGRIGGSRLEVHEDAWFSGDDLIFDGDMGLALGCGIRGTIYEQNGTKFGAVGVFNWSQTEDQRQRFFSDQPYTSAEIEYYEVMLACGVVHPLAPNVNVYGGPFFYWFDGDIKGKGAEEYDYNGNGNGGYDIWKVSGDIEEDGNFGGYLGALFDITDNWSLAAEFQYADGASGFGVNAVWTF
ncbi:MAG: hypothetical protein ACETVZ_06990 [Phycisphaerae bacterium]